MWCLLSWFKAVPQNLAQQAFSGNHRRVWDARGWHSKQAYDAQKCCLGEEFTRFIWLTSCEIERYIFLPTVISTCLCKTKWDTEKRTLGASVAEEDCIILSWSICQAAEQSQFNLTSHPYTSDRTASDADRHLYQTHSQHRKPRGISR